MKNNQKITKATGFAVGLGLALAASGSVNASETLVGLVSGSNQIFYFDSSDPTTILGSYGITASDTLMGIDYWGNTLYGVGSSGKVYILPQTGGAATLLASVPIGSLGGGLYYGVDASAAGIRIVTDADVNVLVNYGGGYTVDTSLNPSSLTISAISSYGSTMYGIDKLPSQYGVLNTINTSLGTASSIGVNLGYQISRINGFDISAASGIAYFASAVSSSGPVPDFFTVDLTTGVASIVNQFGLEGGQYVSGITVVPEPTTTALAVLGGVGMLAMLRRRK